MLQVTVDAKEFKKWTRRWPDQVGFATSKAMNKTALQVQRAARSNLKKKFIIRRPRFAEMSIKIRKFAKKRDLESIIQVISPGSPDTFSKFQEGGIKRARESRRIAIPVDIQPNPSKVIPRSKRPQQLVSSGKASIIKARSGQELILLRKGRGRRRENVVAYTLEDSVRIPRTLDFYKTAAGVFTHNWQRNFAQEFEAAIRSAR